MVTCHKSCYGDVGKPCQWSMGWWVFTDGSNDAFSVSEMQELGWWWIGHYDQQKQIPCLLLTKKSQLEHKWKITGLCFLALLPVMPVMCVQLTTALRFSYLRAISSRRFKGQLLLVFVPVMWHICLARASRQMIKELIFMPWLFHWSTKSTATCKRAKGKIKKRTPTSCIHDIFFPLLPCRDTLEFHYKINAAKCTSGSRKELQITTCVFGCFLLFGTVFFWSNPQTCISKAKIYTIALSLRCRT